MYLVQPVYKCPAQLVSGASSARQQYDNASSSKSPHYKKEVKEAFMRKNTHKAKIKKRQPCNSREG